MIFTQPLKCEDQYSFILAAGKLFEAELHEAALICTDSHGHCSSTQAHVALIQARQLKITRLPNLYQEETAKRQTSCRAFVSRATSVQLGPKPHPDFPHYCKEIHKPLQIGKPSSQSDAYLRFVWRRNCHSGVDG